MKRLAASIAVLGLLLFSSDPADACSPACVVPKLAPVAGATVPASAPGFLFIGYGGETSDAALLDANGAAVAGSYQKDSASGRTYFAPSSALTPGNYAVRSLKSCSGSETVDSAFTVTASATLPTSTGSLSVKKTGRESLSATTSSGSCVEPVDAAYVDLDVATDPALAPYLSIVTWQTKVDGQWWSQKDPIASSVAPEGNARSYLRLFAACDGKTSTGRDEGLSAGKHAVEVRAFLPGAAPLAPATLSVDVTCNGDDLVGDGEIPGGGTSTGSGSGSGAGSGSGSRFGASGASSSTSGSGAQDGCSSTPHVATSSTSISAAIVALLALAGLRRRRNTLD